MTFKDIVYQLIKYKIYSADITADCKTIIGSINEHLLKLARLAEI